MIFTLRPKAAASQKHSLGESLSRAPTRIVARDFKMYIIISKRTQRAVSPVTYYDKQEAESNRKEMEHPDDLESVPAGIYD